MVGYNKRCQAVTLKGRRCKKAFSFVCNKARCCTIHAYTYALYALTIQKAYKGYRARKYVKLLVRLPCDIQQKILFYVRQPYYNARKNKCIQAILCKKFVSIFGTPKSIWSGFVVTNANAFLGDYKSRVLTMNKTQFNDHVLDITHLHNLYIKYIALSDFDYNTMLYYITNIVKRHIDECVHYYHHSGPPYLYSDAELLVLHNNTTKLQNSITIYKSDYMSNLRMRNLQNTISV